MKGNINIFVLACTYIVITAIKSFIIKATSGSLLRGILKCHRYLGNKIFKERVSYIHDSPSSCKVSCELSVFLVIFPIEFKCHLPPVSSLARHKVKSLLHCSLVVLCIYIGSIISFSTRNAFMFLVTSRI